MSKASTVEFFKNNISRISQWKNNVDKTLLISKLHENNIYFLDFNFTGLTEELTIYLFNLDDNFLICEYPTCNNKKIYNKFSLKYDGRYQYGFKRYCSKECKHKQRKLRQIGENNTCHKITKEKRLDMNKRQSENVKNKIKNGTFKPNITNSWAGSKVSLNIDGKHISYRSSWDAFFHLCNQHLEYEKLIIQYKYKDCWHNYITDFVDHKNKIFYEIKPESNLHIEKNRTKFQYAVIWAKEHNYEFKIISDVWFKDNFNINNHLLDEQKDKQLITRRLNKICNEN